MLLNLDRGLNWRPPREWTQITTVDAHSAGEPLRVILGGFPTLEGGTILDKRRDALENHDALRKALMWEPRGHADMYGCLVVPPVSPEADFGVLFLHNEGYSTMCGHGIIAVTTVILETGMLPAKEPETVVRIDTPAGLVTARASVDEGRVSSVAFENVPSFVLFSDRLVEVPGLGLLRYDVAFGGAFYAFVEAEDAGVALGRRAFPELVEKGMAIKRAIIAAGPIEHPFEDDLSFLYGTIFTGASRCDEADSRNVCVFAEGEVDRSPTGTGVSARAALLVARGELSVGDSMTIESIIGSKFRVKALSETVFGEYLGVVPEVRGSAAITGRHEFVINPDDSLGSGFLLR